MITLKTTESAVNLNNIFTDNKGAFSYTVSGNTVTLRPKNYSSRYSARFSDYECDGQIFQTVEELTEWMDSNLFYDGGGSGEGLQKATVADAQAGTDNSKYVTPQVLNTFVYWVADSLIYENETNTELTLTQLNATYPDALPRTTVYATDLQLKYIKINDTTWEVMPYSPLSE